MTKDFARFARPERIDDAALCEAVARAERELVDANLGGGLIKQRVPRRGEGRSGGYRTILAWHQGERCFFMYGFAKSTTDNIDDDDLKRLKVVGSVLLGMNAAELAKSLARNKLVEVLCHG
jgi:hypothetical protein